MPPPPIIELATPLGDNKMDTNFTTSLNIQPYICHTRVKKEI